MNILDQLSSRKGDKTEASNLAVVAQCIQNPKLLEEVLTGFTINDKKLQSDAIEVFTKVAETHPQYVVPFARAVVPLLDSKETKTRWEALHTLALIADQVPDVIFSVLPRLQQLVEHDKSTIVLDYTLDCIANYAQTGKEAAVTAFPLLKQALALRGEKHAKHVFKGFGFILDHLPACKGEIRQLTEPYLDAKKKVVVAEAKKVLKRI